jgi:uncharacterized protein
MKGMIVVHRYKSNGCNIVLDVNSGCVHVVDDLVYELIPLLEPLVNEGIKDRQTIQAAALALLSAAYSPEDIIEATEEILALEKVGQLFTPDIYKDYVFDFKNRQTVVKALCLHVTHDCNLACKYCFAQEGEYHGQRGLMSLEVGRAALDFLVRSSGNRVQLEVDFFGGEPLMNWDVVKELVAYGRSLEAPNGKKFRFTLTTNGVLLNDEVMEFANREMSNMVFSLDGRKKVQDRMRPFRNGKGSYDLLVPKIREAATRRGERDYYVRGTFTRENLDFAADVLQLADLGFDRISVEPVVSDENESYAIIRDDIPVLCGEYDKLTQEMLKRRSEGKDFCFFHFQIDLEGGPCVAKRLSGCGSGTEYLAVTPWGDLYPCHQFVGNEEFLMGNVWEGVRREDIRQEFKSCNVYAKEECKTCFAKFTCSGGCAANGYHAHKDIHRVYEMGCDLMRKRVECAIALKAAEIAQA